MMCSSRTTGRERGILFGFVFCAIAFLAFIPLLADAATLRLTPDTGVYGVGNTFSVRVVVNTQGEAINAAEGQLSFNTSELAVASVTRAGSIFNLWTLEPEYSNTSGRISFGGGSPSGYTGSAGTVMSVTFRALKPGSPRVTFTSGSILAADGLGTNVLSGMQGGAYTVNPTATTPEPEYVALPNTPGAPTVRSSTHPDPSQWYTAKTAAVSFDVPADVTAVRTLLDESPSTIPTVVYEPPITERTIDDLPEGESYFHVQFRNTDGWGKVAHYRLGIDTEKPTAFTVSPHEENDPSAPSQKLIFAVEDAASGVAYFMVQIDGGEPEKFIDESGTGVYETPALEPGHHTLIAEAFDHAGNSLATSYSFDIASFPAPVFTEYPTKINEEVIPVIRGTTRPGALVTISFGAVGSLGSGQAVASTYEVRADESGIFTFIPDGRLGRGVYELSAVATDQYGAKSDRSEAIRIAVEEPGYLRIGGMVMSILSIIIPTLALLVLLALGLWLSWHRFSLLRTRVRKEVGEAERSLAKEFDGIIAALKESVVKLEESRKGKLTKAESTLIKSISSDLDAAEKRVRKEIEDIERIVR